jgi:hypothetical protein
MNERIRQLADEAGFETNEANITIGNYVRDKEYFYADDFIEDELKKFAELIVQECIDIIAPYTVRMSRPGEEYLHPISEIKKNFGVN